MASRSANSPVVGAVFAIIGIGILMLAIYLYNTQSEFIAKGIKVPGTVIDNVIGGEDNDVYFPMVQFKSRDGEERRFTASTGSSPPMHNVGEPVEVIYDPDNPDDAQINSTFDLWFGPILCAGLGAIFTLVGIGVFVAGLKSKAMEIVGQRSQNALETLGAPGTPEPLGPGSSSGPGSPVPPIPPSPPNQGPILK
jgi:hypothetical protein